MSWSYSVQASAEASCAGWAYTLESALGGAMEAAERLGNYGPIVVTILEDSPAETVEPMRPCGRFREEIPEV